MGACVRMCVCNCVCMFYLSLPVARHRPQPAPGGVLPPCPQCVFVLHHASNLHVAAVPQVPHAADVSQSVCNNDISNFNL